MIGVVDGESPAARAGLLSGDRIAAVDGQEIEDWAGLVAAYAGVTEPVVFDVVRSAPAPSIRNSCSCVPCSPSRVKRRASC